MQSVIRTPLQATSTGEVIVTLPAGAEIVNLASDSGGAYLVALSPQNAENTPIRFHLAFEGDLFEDLSPPWTYVGSVLIGTHVGYLFRQGWV